MIAELDIYRAANILLTESGAEEARLMAAKGAKAMIELGDVDVATNSAKAGAESSKSSLLPRAFSGSARSHPT